MVSEDYDERAVDVESREFDYPAKRFRESI